jgi:hypothetical protein
LSEVAAKLPLLEELEISYCSLSKEALKAVGRCCPHLKSLKFNNRGRYHEIYEYMSFCQEDQLKHDEVALAIAENMSELRHLQLFGNTLTNNGVQAILDGCPHLESLDLRQCFNTVSLTENVSRRCAEQITDLRLVFDSTYDYEFDDSYDFVPDYSSLIDW